MDIESYLEKLGLGQQEAKVYLASLKLGLSKASQIARKSNTKREATYYTLSLLHERGFISEVIKSGVKYYSAVSPKRIIELIEEEKERKVKLVEEIMPELDALQKVAITKPKIEVYEGSDGLKTTASIMTKEKNQTIYSYVSESILKFTPYFNPHFRARRRENKVLLKVITSKTPETQELRKQDKEELREIRFDNGLLENIDSSFYILNNGIIILKANEKEQMGIYVQDPSVAKLQKKIFEELWKQAKK